MSTHRAVIEFAVPPRMEVIAQGPRDFCANALTRWLDQHPVTPYSDDDTTSGGVPMLMEVVTTDEEAEFYRLISDGYSDLEAADAVWPS